MSVEFPEPSGETGDAAVLLPRYLDFFRQTVVRKVRSLSERDRRETRLPSGWTPLELLAHLAYMEQRWFVWGFWGEPVEEPWGDVRDERWHVPESVGFDDLVHRLEAVGRRSDAALASHGFDELAPPGPRFTREPPTLGWIAFHVLQEYARHAGHLDIAVELAGGDVGE